MPERERVWVSVLCCFYQLVSPNPREKPHRTFWPNSRCYLFGVCLANSSVRNTRRLGKAINVAMWLQRALYFQQAFKFLKNLCHLCWNRWRKQTNEEGIVVESEKAFRPILRLSIVWPRRGNNARFDAVCVLISTKYQQGEGGVHICGGKGESGACPVA